MAAESAATVEPDDKAATAAVDAPRAPVSASGYEPPVPQADSNTAVETPADHPTSPAPEPENEPTAPGDLPERIDTPAEPSQVVETDALGDRKRVVEGKGGSVRVDPGGRRQRK